MKHWTLKLVFVIFLIIILAISPLYAAVPSGTARVARVTGATPFGEILPNPNQSHTNYKVMGTDLGIMWDAGGGRIMMAFGDTYGVGWSGTGPGPDNADWRSNVLAISTDTNLEDGLSFSSMITDTPGHAKQIISSAHNTSGTGDWTSIPTAGITIGTRHYIHYMNVRSWGDHGIWTTNYSEIAYSDNNGVTWTKSGTQWSGPSNFAQAAFAKSDGYLYMFGTPSGRFGNAYLARVPEANVLTKSSYQYWNGINWVVNNEAAAVPVVIAPVAELSVQYNNALGRWIMMYLDQNRNYMILRESPSLTGPWSGARVVCKPTNMPGYGGFIHPWSSGNTIYFVLSRWDIYNVFLAKTTLNSDPQGDNMITDPGFEDHATSNVTSPWYKEGNAGVDRNLGYARTGSNNAYVRFNSGWNCIKQKVAVTPQTNYRLTGYIRTSANNTKGKFGVRNTSGSVIKEVAFGRYDAYTQFTVDFNAGTNSIVEVYAGLTATSDTWIQIDDLSLTKSTTSTVVIKDNDAGTPGYTETGAWTTSSGTGYNGGTYRYASVGAGKTAVWNLNLPSAGNWRISVIYKSGTNRATSAKYNVTTASGIQTVYTNQTLNDLTWVTLGTWSFNAGGGIVTLDAGGSTPTGQVVIADAVKAELQ